jgi:hypothetical protein
MPREPVTGDGLNENHLRHIYATCHHIDKLLTAIEGMLDASAPGALFHRFEQTLSPGTRAAVLDGVGRVRATVAAILRRHAIPIPPPAANLASNIRSTLGFIDLDIEEIRPEYMGGYGHLGLRAAADLDAMVAELRQQLAGIAALLPPAHGPDGTEGRAP